MHETIIGRTSKDLSLYHAKASFNIVLYCFLLSGMDYQDQAMTSPKEQTTVDEQTPSKEGESNLFDTEEISKIPKNVEDSEKVVIVHILRTSNNNTF